MAKRSLRLSRRKNVNTNIDDPKISGENGSGDEGASKLSESEESSGIDLTASDGFEGATIDPEKFEPVSSDPEPSERTSEQPTERRKPGRPKGYSPKQQGRKSAFQKSGNLEKLLVVTHGMLAKFFKIDMLAIDNEEGKVLADAILDVERAYGFPILTEKQEAIAGLIVACGMVYGPRIVIAMAITGKKNVTIEAPTIVRPVQTANN